MGDRLAERGSANATDRAAVTSRHAFAAVRRHIHAALRQVAGIFGANVSIVAGERLTGGAGTRYARVTSRASVSIIARGASFEGRRVAALLRVASVHGAGVAVVAWLRLAADTGASLADIADGADASIITSRAVSEGVDAAAITLSGAWVADVFRAGFTIITSDRFATGALATDTGITTGAGVAVIAVVPVRRFVLTAGVFVARIGGAGVAVFTVLRFSGRAATLHAGVTDGADVAVIARCVAHVVLAPFGRVTPICGAGAAIIAVHCGTDTGARSACISGRAERPVAAGFTSCTSGVTAGRARIYRRRGNAEVHRAGVAIVAVFRAGDGADPVFTQAARALVVAFTIAAERAGAGCRVDWSRVGHERRVDGAVGVHGGPAGVDTNPLVLHAAAGGK